MAGQGGTRLSKSGLFGLPACTPAGAAGSARGGPGSRAGGRLGDSDRVDENAPGPKPLTVAPAPRSPIKGGSRRGRLRPSSSRDDLPGPKDSRGGANVEGVPSLGVGVSSQGVWDRHEDVDAVVDALLRQGSGVAMFI